MPCQPPQCVLECNVPADMLSCSRGSLRIDARGQENFLISLIYPLTYTRRVHHSLNHSYSGYLAISKRITGAPKKPIQDRMLCKRKADPTYQGTMR